MEKRVLSKEKGRWMFMFSKPEGRNKKEVRRGNGSRRRWREKKVVDEMTTIL